MSGGAWSLQSSFTQTAFQPKPPWDGGRADSVVRNFRLGRHSLSLELSMAECRPEHSRLRALSRAQRGCAVQTSLPEHPSPSALPCPRCPASPGLPQPQFIYQFFLQIRVLFLISSFLFHMVAWANHSLQRLFKLLLSTKHCARQMQKNASPPIRCSSLVVSSPSLLASDWTRGPLHLQGL